MLAHLSVLAGLAGLMPLGALIIWLVYKDRSQRVGFHALQALWYQVAWLVILIVGWFATFILSFVLIGLLWFGLYNVALNQGERTVDAGTAAMLIQVSPVLIALLAGPLAVPPARTVLTGGRGPALIGALQGTGLLTLITGILLATGLALSA